MNYNRRIFGLQTMSFASTPSRILVPVSMVGITATALVLPRRANAIAPFLLGTFMATALYELFNDFGLTTKLLSTVAAANARRASKPADFDGMFADDVELNVAQAWRFENGKIVGVNGAAYGGDPLATRRASLNVNELDALRHTDTLSELGPMVPSSMRTPPDQNRQKVVVAYKEAQAQKQRTRTNRIPDPMYAREFEKMDDGSKVYGVFGRAKDDSLLVAWVDPRDVS